LQKVLLALVAGTFVGTGSMALAADLPTKAVPLAPSIGWTGFYVGLNAGYGKTKSTDVTETDAAPLIVNIPASQRTFSIDGSSRFTGGIQAGYNWQFAPKWVVGLEADINSFRSSGDATQNFMFGGAFPGSFTASRSTDWFGTVRARLGALPMDNLLIYGTGGFAYGNVKTSATINNNFGAGLVLGVPVCAANSVCYQGSGSRTATGWTAGAGLEYAAWKNLSVKLEYLYVNLGSDTLTVLPSTTTTGGGSASFAFNNYVFNIVRAGVNVRF
jgi:outer membrane immunogenic protein